MNNLLQSVPLDSNTIRDNPLASKTTLFHILKSKNHTKSGERAINVFLGNLHVHDLNCLNKRLIPFGGGFQSKQKSTTNVESSVSCNTSDTTPSLIMSARLPWNSENEHISKATKYLRFRILVR